MSLSVSFASASDQRRAHYSGSRTGVIKRDKKKAAATRKTATQLSNSSEVSTDAQAEAGEIEQRRTQTDATLIHYSHKRRAQKNKPSHTHAGDAKVNFGSGNARRGHRTPPAMSAPVREPNHPAHPPAFDSPRRSPCPNAGLSAQPPPPSEPAPFLAYHPALRCAPSSTLQLVPPPLP